MKLVPERAAIFCLAGAVALTMVAGCLSPTASVSAQAAPADPAGAQLFDRRCSGCHSLDSDKEGPRLRGVYGRKSGSVPGFTYSAALRAANITWNEDTLDRWLAQPDNLVLNTDMDFHVPKADERAAIIRFLRLSSGSAPGK